MTVRERSSAGLTPLAANTIRRLWPQRHEPHERALLRECIRAAQSWLRWVGRK